MNTPAHAIASILLWSGEPGWPAAIAITVGAWLPDLPMFAFYGYKKFHGVSDRTIWSKYYYQPGWQLLFDIPHSLFLMISLAALCAWQGFPTGALLFGSAILHLCCDFPLHHEDAHRHFLPFSRWRFLSPVSYWDPKRFGRIIFRCECLFVCAATGFVLWTSPNMPMQFFACINCIAYLFNVIRTRFR
jgi:hypothetical protein